MRRIVLTYHNVVSSDKDLYLYDASYKATKSQGHKVTRSQVEYRVVISKERRGKVSLLNEIVPQAKGEIIVFSDARQIFKKDALRNLVANFADEKVGCVSGELVFVDEDKASVSKGIGFYWQYEKWMRKMESRISSAVGATGAIYAIRKNLYVAPPQGTILDDVFIPLKVVEQGFRVIFDSEAVAYDRIVSTSKEEFKRKTRTLAGNFQLFFQFKKLLNPLRSKVAFQFFSHKFLRAIAFFFLIILFVLTQNLHQSFEKLCNLFKMLQLYSKALHQKDTKANHSPFLMGWVNPALSKERAVLRTNFSNEKFGLNLGKGISQEGLYWNNKK